MFKRTVTGDIMFKRRVTGDIRFKRKVTGESDIRSSLSKVDGNSRGLFKTKSIILADMYFNPF